MKTRKIKTNKGITLIALVITIIVLLILAGVTIAMITGDNGILTKTTEAKNKTAEATAKEKVQTEVMASYGTDGNINIDELNKNLQNISGIKYNGSAISDSNKIASLPATVTVDGYNEKEIYNKLCENKLPIEVAETLNIPNKENIYEEKANEKQR